MSREAIDALERWHATTRALREARPGTSDWVRLRMVAREERAAYEALLEGDDGSGVLEGRDREPAERIPAR